LAGYDMKSEYTLRGRIHGADADLTVDEDHTFRLLVAQSPSRRRVGQLGGKSGSSRTVTYSDDKVRNTLTIGRFLAANTYKWNARFVKDFVNGKVPATMPTAWRCEGKISKNNQDWAKYKMDATGRRVHGKVVGNVRTFVIVTPEGKTILQHFQ
ncbi:MAG: hypothetical protein OER88_06085, partial [Planctomycetota bacterium]|nr:hypothetical protein [Planctomycetota bacterium]